jgi:chromate reductase
MTKVLGICGSLRAESFNLKLLHHALEAFGGDYEIGSIRMPLYDGDLEDLEGAPIAARRLATQIAEADAIIIATPEYNKSIPGGLKNALDWVSRLDGRPWQDKPVSIMSAAAGRAGGERSQYALRLALSPFGPRLLTGREVLIGNASAEFGDDGRLSGERAIKALEANIAALKALIPA